MDALVVAGGATPGESGQGGAAALPAIHTGICWSVYSVVVRINISIPDDLHAEIKALSDDGDAESVSGFLATAARKALAYYRDARMMDELFGPAGLEEQALIESMRSAGSAGHAA
ncbi:ribbon-helix-helix domain-containing protein [Nocardia sp. NPDC051570]|uniref:ribbon-helix-helix domain-containing protein n=1 Tax=Nocardia sp. NPDC051570 TaxID=3364324 RepID=UPI0037ACA236